MSVFTLGLNHTTAPLDLRGRFAFAPQQLVDTLKAFRSRLERVEEVALVSTCNRTELYLGAAQGAVEPAVDWLAGMGGVSSATLRSHAYVLEGPSAARHAFRVASGLDSMVLGEPQILGQLKQAVREADSAGTLGSTLQQMFQRSFAVAQGGADVDRDRHPFHQHGRCCGAPGRAVVRRPARERGCCSSVRAR